MKAPRGAEPVDDGSPHQAVQREFDFDVTPGPDSADGPSLLETFRQKGSWQPPPGPPRLSLALIQRFVLRRVFELGWTTERFGALDLQVRFQDKDSQRIGKKYQWIAYHEVLARVADRFQFFREYGARDDPGPYEGPWELRLRDIDPSFPMRPGVADADDESRIRWHEHAYERWGEGLSADEWTNDSDYAPRIDELLAIEHPEDGSRWYVGGGTYQWTQDTPPDLDPSEEEVRSIWLRVTGFIVRCADVDQLLAWAKGRARTDRWLPDARGRDGIFLGEHGWSPAWKYARKAEDRASLEYPEDCPVPVIGIGAGYGSTQGEFDKSEPDSYEIQVPVAELAEGLRLTWSGAGADFVDSEGRVVATDPSAHHPGRSRLLIREDRLTAYLRAQQCCMAWALSAEKRAVVVNTREGSFLNYTGVYVAREGNLSGFTKFRSSDDTVDPWEEDL